MTNTLHRKGPPHKLKNDFVVFALPKAGVKDLIGKLIRFTNICLKHKPVNMGKVEDRSLRRIDPRRLEEEMAGKIGLTATFDNIDALAAMIADLQEADLGISINVSGLLDEVDRCCGKEGMMRHSTEQSLGVFGRTDLLPPWPIVEINSMCGHGLVSFNLIKRVLDEVKLARMTPAEGAWHLAKPCECGAFNLTRAAQMLEELRLKG
ncbi:MAG: hypothetical protein GY866_40130 [Proteobacteria bacterium]|nr:hypothetical protein [Pseudomonadota bacterium]